MGTVEDIADRQQAEVANAQVTREQAAHQEAETANRMQDEFIAVLADVSQIVRGKLQLHCQPLDLAAIAQTALETVRPAAAAKAIVLVDNVAAAARLEMVGDALLGRPSRLAEPSPLARMAKAWYTCAMSSGRTHDRITLWALPLVVLAAFRVTLSGWLTTVVCLGFLLGGWMLGPDLDIHSVQYKRWGWLRWIWLPYRGRIRHRSHWSHGPILGTVVRVLYLSLWLSFGGLLLVDLLNSAQRTALSWGELIDGLGWALITYWPWWLALVVGLELGALSHYVTDWISSASKGKRGRSKKRRR